VRRANLIQVALKDFGNLDLPDLVAGAVISNAEKLLSTRINSLTPLSDTERLTLIRQTVLEVIAAQSVVTGLGVFGAPTGTLDILGAGNAFADSTRPANGAILATDKLGPYILYAGDNESDSTNILYIYADTSAVFPAPPTYKLFIPPSRFAKVEGLNPGPFTISAGINDNFQLLINGITTVNCPLPTGTSVTAAAVEAALNTALNPHGFMAEGFFSPLMFDGGVTTTAGNTLALPIGNFPPSSVSIGDEVDFYFGTNATTTRTVTAVNLVGGNIVSIQVGGAALTPATDDRIQYGSSARRIRILPSNIPTSLAAGDFIQVKQPTAVERNVGITLGFYGEISAITTLTDAATISNYINGNVPTVRSSLNLVSSIGPLTARTEASNVLTFVVYLMTSLATWTSGTFVTVVLLEKITDTRIVDGCQVVLRAGPNNNLVGAILGINVDGVTLTVGFGSPIEASTQALPIEIMPPFPFVQKGMVLTVASGVNSGKYYIDVPDPTISGQFKARLPPPLPRDNFNQNVVMPSADIGKEGFNIISKSPALTSSISVYDQHLVWFITHTPGVTTTTNYFKLPSLPASLLDGDFLDIHTTHADAVDISASIVGIDSDGVIQLDTAIAFNLFLEFGTTALPFGVLRQAIVNNFNTFAAALTQWAAHFPVSNPAYFDNLNGLINPLLKNTNPTDGDVGTAENAIRQIYKFITIAGASAVGADPKLTLEAIIDAYTAQVVPQIDTMITTYTQKGADRAMDLLLEPQFSTFFGLSQQQSSYAGNFQAAAQAVALNDLPVVRVNRAITSKSQLTGTAQSPDYERDSSDLDPTPIIDPPADIDRTA
jgi:hypothetical protein